MRQKGREEQVSESAAREEAVIQNAAREDAELATTTLENSSSLSVATQTDQSAEEVGHMKRACEVRVVRESVLTRNSLQKGA